MESSAKGSMKITGNVFEIINFLDNFIFEKSIKPVINDRKFVCRTYIDENREDIIKQLKKDNLEPLDITTLTLSICCDFSAYIVMIEGYPILYPNEAMTIKEACKRCGVCVDIDTVLSGNRIPDECVYTENIKASGFVLNYTCSNLEYVREQIKYVR